MRCRVQDLRNKDVICISDGSALGCVNDVEVDTVDARVIAIVIFGRPKFFGLLGREEDCIIPWGDIEIIGEDAVLVNCMPMRPRRKKRPFSGLFGPN